MRKKSFVRFQIFLIMVLVGLVIWRMNEGPEKGDGFISLVDMKVGHLYTEHFEVKDLVTLQIEGVGAFGADERASTLAAYPWLVNRTTNRVVWMPDMDRLTRDGVAALIRDSVAVGVGEYSAFFTTLGPEAGSQNNGSFLGLKPHWTNDAEIFELNLTANIPDVVRPLDRLVTSETDTEGSSAFWSFTPSWREGGSSQMVRIKGEGSVNVRVQGTFAICNTGCDTLELYRLPSETPVWSSDDAEASEAGGSDVNAIIDEELSLKSGLYRIEFSTGRKQDAGDWKSNPPHLPYQWGASMHLVGEGTAFTYDPWSGAEPLVAMLQVGNDEELSMSLELDQSLDILAFSMGELSSDQSRYDFGWIENTATGDRVWELDFDESVHAGGDKMNRESQSILTLPPGNYTVRYRSDGSHSYEDWNKSEPIHPNRWGIALFVVDPSSVSDGAVRVTEIEQTWESDPAPTDFPVIEDATILVQSIRMGNDATFDEILTLSEATEVRIRALGEITSSSRYDFGWLKEAESGRIVWEMTFENTSHAGGDDRNRIFSGTMTLGPGSYIAHFETDLSYAWGNFDQDLPVNSDQWGISISRVE